MLFETPIFGATHIKRGSRALTVQQASDGRFDGALEGTGALTKTGLGVLKLALVDAGSLAGAGSIALGGTLDISGPAASAALSNLSGSAGAGLVLGDRTLTLAQSGGAEFAGQIDVTGTLAKTGTGALVLSGNSSAFDGSTALQAGS